MWLENLRKDLVLYSDEQVTLANDVTYYRISLLEMALEELSSLQLDFATAAEDKK